MRRECSESLAAALSALSRSYPLLSPLLLTSFSSSLLLVIPFYFNLISSHRLNGGTLDGSQLSVTLPGSSASLSNPTDDSTNTNSLGQEDKPRTAIVAEYLAHGYALSDDITKRAIELDSKHGLSTRFKSYLSSLDRSLGQRVASASNKKLTESNEHTPSGNVASEAVLEKDASKTPVPGSNPNDLGPKTTTQVPGATSTTQEPSLARTVQERANQVLERPEIKEKTTFAWSKLTEVS